MPERILPEKRRAKLRELLSENKFLRVMEVHNGLSAIVANNAYITKPGLEEKIEFDGMWISSLTDSAAKGQPDVEIVSFDSRLETIAEVSDVTTKPIIVDGDTGGDPNNFEYFVRRLERLGVSAIIVEDKVYPKRNSLDAGAKQQLEDPEAFAGKIARGLQARLTPDFMIFARIESLIAGAGLEDALSRAKTYLKAGADGIFIHSKSKKPDEVLAFAEKYKLLEKETGISKPLICVPTTYNSISEDELQKAGFNVVIYANHLLRSAHKAMELTARTILNAGRSFEADPYCTPVENIFSLLGMDEIKKKDAASVQKLKVLIPAAGRHDNLGDLCTTRPCALLPFGNSTVIQYQITELKKQGVNDFVVVRGPHQEKIDLPGVRYYDTPTHDKGILTTLFEAEKEYDSNMFITYSDILFSADIIKKMLSEADDADIAIAVDDSYRMRREEFERHIDFVVTTVPPTAARRLRKPENHILRIGTRIPPEQAHAEFIGIAYLSKNGADYLRQLYNDCKNRVSGAFHEADSFEKASLIDLLQEAIDRGYRVKAVEISQGWRELHTPEDYEKAKAELESEK